MPTAPSARMRTLARRWFSDTVTLQSVTVGAGTRDDPLGTTYGTGYTVSANIRQSADVEIDGETVRRDQRDLTVWVDDSTVTPTAGWRCTVVTCPGDTSLVGKVGEVIGVERDGKAVVRRLQVRLPNDD